MCVLPQEVLGWHPPYGSLRLAKGLGGKGKIDVQRFKGLGEMDAKDLKDTTMNPDP